MTQCNKPAAEIRRGHIPTTAAENRFQKNRCYRVVLQALRKVFEHFVFRGLSKRRQTVEMRPSRRVAPPERGGGGRLAGHGGGEARDVGPPCTASRPPPPRSVGTTRRLCRISIVCLRLLRPLN